MMWRIGALVLCCLTFCTYGQTHVGLQELIQTQGLRNAILGISVKQVEDGKKVVEYLPEVSLIPASVTKLIPTWLALQEKGADYQYRTQVYFTGTIEKGVLSGDVVVKADGDPCLDSRYFPAHSLVKSLVKSIREKNISQIRGKIKVEGAMEGINIPGSWPWEDISNYYAALYLPFNYRDNMYTLQFRSKNPGSRVELIAVEPTLPGIILQNEVCASSENKDNAWIYGGPYSSELYVKGTIPPNRSLYKVKGAMHCPALFFVHELKDCLKQEGIVVEDKECAEKDRTELLNLFSPPLKEIVYYTNKVSVNLFAEALGKLVGGENWEDRVKAYFTKSGIDASGILLKDACGLSPMNVVPAEAFTDLLVNIAAHDQVGFIYSLPLGGVDGGLAGYCNLYPHLKNNLRAKTGSMSGVRGLAGYLTGQSGKQLAFTILVNHYTCSTADLQRAVGKFLNSL